VSVASQRIAAANTAIPAISESRFSQIPAFGATQRNSPNAQPTAAATPAAIVIRHAKAPPMQPRGQRSDGAGDGVGNRVIRADHQEDRREYGAGEREQQDDRRQRHATVCV
jgi:hypothetical protein